MNENRIRTFAKMSKEKRNRTPFPGRDEIWLREIDSNIVTVGRNASGTGTAVYIQDGSLPARNVYGNETGKTLLEEWMIGNLTVCSSGFNRGKVFAVR